MSHWTKIKLQLTEQDILVKALQRMGFTPEQGQFKISQYGQTSEAEVRVGTSVGFAKQKDGTFSMVGDFYHSNGKLKEYYNQNDKFQQDLNVAYGIEDAKQKLEDLGMGFEIAENEQGVIGKDGMIRMVAVSYS
jgi:hypothetical protein